MAWRIGEGAPQMWVSVGRGREENEPNVLCERVKPSRRRLRHDTLRHDTEQTVAVVVLGCGKKVDAMWHTSRLTSDKCFSVPNFNFKYVYMKF